MATNVLVHLHAHLSQMCTKPYFGTKITLSFLLFKLMICQHLSMSTVQAQFSLIPDFFLAPGQVRRLPSFELLQRFLACFCYGVYYTLFQLFSLPLLDSPSDFSYQLFIPYYVYYLYLNIIEIMFCYPFSPLILLQSEFYSYRAVYKPLLNAVFYSTSLQQLARDSFLFKTFLGICYSIFMCFSFYYHRCLFLGALVGPSAILTLYLWMFQTVSRKMEQMYFFLFILLRITKKP